MIDLGVKYYIFDDDIKVKEEYGEWAVITGGTDGIGLGYAKELAKQNVNLILISRSNEKLKEISLQLTKEYNIKVKTFAINLLDIEKHEEELQELHKYDIGLLVLIIYIRLIMLEHHMNIQIMHIYYHLIL